MSQVPDVPADDTVDNADSERSREIAARCAGSLTAVKLLEPQWKGFAAAVEPFLKWAATHQPRG